MRLHKLPRMDQILHLSNKLQRHLRQLKLHSIMRLHKVAVHREVDTSYCLHKPLIIIIERPQILGQLLPHQARLIPQL